MSHKDEAKAKIDTASNACETALDSWRAGIAVLGTNVSVNGFGIINDRHAFRQRLREAQAHIAASLAVLDGVDEWPNSFDYDQL